MSSAHASEEDRRLASLHALMVLDSEPEPIFDTLARLACEVCGTPIALLSLIDAHRQWFKAKVGLPGVSETPREVAFCDHAIRGDTLFEVPDAQKDPRFCDNPLVTGEPDIRFYAGAPLLLASGERIGTLCVIDRTARCLTQAQAAQLQHLAQAAVQALEMRQRLIERSAAVRSTRELAVAESEARLRSILDAQTDLVSQSDPDGRLVYVNPAYAANLGRTVQATTGTSLFDYVDAGDRELVRERIDWVLSTGQTLTSENRMLMPGGEEHWIAWTNVRQLDAQGLPLLHSTGRDVSARVRAERALRSSRAFLTRTGRVAGVGGWELDIATSAVTWSDETRRIHEVPPDFKPTLQTALAFYPPDSRTRIEAAVQEGLSSGKPWDLELRLVTASGRSIWARAVGEVEFEDGRPVRLVGALQDVSAAVRAQEEIARQTATLRSVADAISSTVSVLDRDGRYRFVNRAFEQLVGRDAGAIIGRSAKEILGAAEFERRRPYIDRVLRGERVRFELEDAVAEGTVHTTVEYMPLALHDDELDGFVVITHDITQHRREQSRLRLLSQTDALTGLLNRAGFEQRMANMLDTAVGEPLAILYVDLDRFKPVNDRYGHAAGDTLLKLVAKRIVRLVRPSDAVARLGGDEFAVMLAGMRDLAQTRRIAQHIVDAARTPFLLADGVSVEIGASVGGALGVAVMGDWTRVLERADRMLYQAKSSGRDRCAIDASAPTSAAN